MHSEFCILNSLSIIRIPDALSRHVVIGTVEQHFAFRRDQVSCVVIVHSFVVHELWNTTIVMHPFLAEDTPHHR